MKISEKDKREIISYIKIVDARHRAGEHVCIKCYVKKVLEVLNKYDKEV